MHEQKASCKDYADGSWQSVLCLLCSSVATVLCLLSQLCTKPVHFLVPLLAQTMGGADAESGHLPEKMKPPDGGWGWIVLLGCFVITGFSYAFPKAVSVYFKELMYDFHVGYSDTAWISSIMLAMLYGTGKEATSPMGPFLCVYKTYAV